MKKVLNYSATIRTLEVGETLSVSWKDLSEASLRQIVMRINKEDGKKFKCSTIPGKLACAVTRI